MSNNKHGLIKESLNNYIFLIIPLSIYIIFFIIPNVQVIFYSFFNWNGLTPIKEFIGIKNFIYLFSDNIFRVSIWHTLVYAATLVLVQSTIGLFIAVLIYRKSKSNIFFRVLIFMPAMLSSVAIGLIWSFGIYDANIGALNNILELLGLENFQRLWLADPKIALFIIVSVHIWMGIGYSMVLFIAGLQGIPGEIYEAAAIDGVNRWQNFKNITLPLLKQTSKIVLILTTVGGFISFDFVYILTRGGIDHSSELIASYLYKRAFVFNNVGYASAISFILLIMVLMISIFQIKVSRED